MTDQILTSNTVVPPSIESNLDSLYNGRSYVHYSAVPEAITPNTTTSSSDNTTSSYQPGTPCVLGVDEAGRGPVIGPMIYGAFYLPIPQHHPLLASTHHFDDSKVLTPAVRANLMQKVSTPTTDLYTQCGWAIKSLSARDISAGMLKNGGSYNLNAQAMDATIEIIKGILDSGVNVREIYIDTIGSPIVYQKKLERIFPTISITVEKKADSLYPCVSAASVVAKVTRDVSCELLYEEYMRQEGIENETGNGSGWGSGYPSDAKCVTWLKGSIDPVFGWGGECRFSWGTVKDMLEVKGGDVARVEWPADDDEEDNMKVSSYFASGGVGGGLGQKTEGDELRGWFGASAGPEVF